MAFSFGGTGAARPTFGTTATTTSATGFGGFGNTATTSSGFSFGSGPSTGFGTSTGFGMSGTTGFGTGTTTGFGTGTSTGFGAGTSTGFGTGTGTGFGAGTTTGFGTGASTGLGTGLGKGLGTGMGFGTGTTTGLSTGFGGGTGLGTGLGAGLGSGLGTTTTGFGTGLGLAGQQQQQQVAQQQQNQAAVLTNMATAVSLPLIFGDERDALIAKWNQLQAFWGTGKGFFNQQGQAVNFSSDNPFCRFKAVGYSCLPSTRNRDGLISVIFTRKSDEIQAKQQDIVSAFHKVLGSKPNLVVCVDGVSSAPDDKTEMIIYVQEHAQTGATKRVSATDLFNFLSQPNIKTQLTTHLAVDSLLPKTGFTSDQLKQYLDKSPAGIDPLIWQQAKLDNPDPEKLIPVPMIGFSELHRRLKHQEQQTKLQQARLDTIAQDVSSLQTNLSGMVSRIDLYKRKYLELRHRVLQVIVKQEVGRKQGYAVQADEEQLRVQLEALQAELNAPTQFKGRLNELMSQMRMQNQLGAARMEGACQMDGSVQQEIRQHLRQQQEGLQHLISIIKDDLEDLGLVEQGLQDTSTQYKR